MLSELTLAIGDAAGGVGFGQSGPTTFGTGMEPMAGIYLAGAAAVFIYFVFR